MQKYELQSKRAVSFFKVSFQQINQTLFVATKVDLIETLNFEMK